MENKRTIILSFPEFSTWVIHKNVMRRIPTREYRVTSLIRSLAILVGEIVLGKVLSVRFCFFYLVLFHQFFHVY
jgi:hypothetical protein